jgi:hypothetical protein
MDTNKNLIFGLFFFIFGCENSNEKKLEKTFWYEEIGSSQRISPKYNSFYNSCIKGEKMDTSKIMFWHFKVKGGFEFCGYRNGKILCPNENKFEDKNKHEKDGFENDLVYLNPGWTIDDDILNINDIKYKIKTISADSILLIPFEELGKSNNIKILLRKLK